MDAVNVAVDAVNEKMGARLVDSDECSGPEGCGRRLRRLGRRRRAQHDVVSPRSLPSTTSTDSGVSESDSNDAWPAHQRKSESTSLVIPTVSDTENYWKLRFFCVRYMPLLYRKTSGNLTPKSSRRNKKEKYTPEALGAPGAPEASPETSRSSIRP